MKDLVYKMLGVMQLQFLSSALQLLEIVILLWGDMPLKSSHLRSESCYQLKIIVHRIFRYFCLTFNII